MTIRYFIAATVFCFAFIPMRVIYAQGEELEGKVITAINITSKHTSAEEISARVLELKKGGIWTADAEAKVKKRLHEMGVFRKLEVKSRYDESSHGVVVDINADDGWYIVPLPLFTSGASGSGFSLMLIEGNMIHRAETLFLRGTTATNTRSATAAIAKGDWIVALEGVSDNYTENQYADGAYNTLGASPDAAKVGQPVNWYTRRSEQERVSVSRKLNDNHKLGVSFSMAKFVIKDALIPTPDEPGRHNMLGLNYTYTHEGNGGISQQGGGMGVVLGLGLSDLDERVQSRKNTGNLQVLEFKGMKAGPFVDSEYDYSILQATWRGVWEFREHDKLAFRVSGTKGWSLPFTQLIPTGPNVGLRGQYRREWRGDKGIGGTASFSHFLSRSKRGILAVESFAESAWVWNGNSRYNQSGAGINLYYQFWRFPLPLGLGYTWSFADKDWVISMSAGFPFGK
ncbi:MAG: hypothetical protein WCS77_00955 [Elusimicrobiaceae bacterium]